LTGFQSTQIRANKILGGLDRVECFGCDSRLTKLSSRFYVQRLETFHEAYSNACR
jgi:hypothetical protein